MLFENGYFLVIDYWLKSQENASPVNKKIDRVCFSTIHNFQFRIIAYKADLLSLKMTNFHYANIPQIKTKIIHGLNNSSSFLSYISTMYSRFKVATQVTQ